MKYLKILISIAFISILAACSKENPFEERGYGKVNTSGLSVELANEDLTRSSDKVDLADFTVEFFLNNNPSPEATYRYGDMPEIISLPVGAYTARAFYGTNPSADWDSPYYTGTTLSSFDVRADQVTVVSDPIVCKFANIKVTIDFTSELRAEMSPDSKVTVKVGEQGSSLDFTLADVGRAGYFAYVENSHSLAATFSGVVEGFATTETKVYDNVQPGNHYHITFNLHTPDEEPGDIRGSILVDASVTIQDVNLPIDDEDNILVDDLRPREEGGDEPGPGPQNNPPTVTAEAPLDFDKENPVNASSTVRIKVKSSSEQGITGFTVDIISDILTAEELEGVGLTSHLDMVNPGEYLNALQGLGFLDENETSLGGKKDINFDISRFMTPLSVFGPNIHKFRFQVTDAYGTTEKTLILRVVE